MQIKEGVRIHGLSAEIIVGLLIADVVFTRHESPLVVTSAIEGQHMNGSLHYIGHAIDVRLPRKEIVSTVMAELILRLGDDFDVVEEDTHIHIEFQPKKRY